MVEIAFIYAVFLLPLIAVFVYGIYLIFRKGDGIGFMPETIRSFPPFGGLMSSESKTRLVRRAVGVMLCLGTLIMAIVTLSMLQGLIQKLNK